MMEGLFGVGGVPVGLGMALAQNVQALEKFASMPESERQKIIDGARGVQSKQEMRAYVERISGQM